METGTQGKVIPIESRKTHGGLTLEERLGGLTVEEWVERLTPEEQERLYKFVKERLKSHQ